MRHIIILWHILLIPLLGYSQICGITDTIVVSSGSTENVQIVIDPMDLINDDLSDPNQGLCGIEISFTHPRVTYLGLSLISPSGQSIQLTGPTMIATTAPQTPFATWRITFLPLTETATPDPNFTTRWNNSLNAATFVAGGQYGGSYYPFNGDLEDFDTGTVSGTWTLVVDNSQSPNPGAILGLRLIFCDETGLDCCFAEAGRLDDPDINVCVGDVALNYVPDNRYSVPRPDADLYGFTYVVSRDSILLFYDSTEVDLTAATPGSYQVCGLSYLRADSLLLPQPDGQYSLQEMFSDLNSLAPSFCGDLTGDCQRILIDEPPPPVGFPVEICEGDTYIFHDSTYTEAGTFPYILQTASGCDSLVNVLLSLIPTQTVNVDSVVCDGESVQIGNSTYNATGTYRDTLSAFSGCDSIVVLDLEVVQDIITTLDTVICRGDSIVINGQAYYETDDFQVTLPSSRLCDSILNVSLLVLNPEINLTPVDTIDCAQPTVTLDASASTPQGSVRFEWQDLAGFTLGTDPTLTVDQPGAYQLLLIQEENGRLCTVRDTVEVADNQSFPIANAGPDQTLTCVETTLTLGGGSTSTGSQYRYEWTTDTGNFLDGQDTPSPRVDAPGNYTLIVTNTSSSCSDTSMVMIDAIQELPTVVLSPDTVISCRNPSILLASAGSSLGPDWTYEWRDSQNMVRGTDPDLVVDGGGIFRLIIRNARSACVDSASVRVNVDTLTPNLTIDPPADINCVNSSVRLNAVADGMDPDVQITWETADGGNILADAGTLTPLVDAAGTYTLILNNARNGCEVFSSVEVVDTRNVLSASPLTPDIISCGMSSVTLDAGTSTTGPDIVYQWATTDGQFTGTSLGPTVTVNAAGTYILTVLDTISRCSDVASVQVERDLDSPLVEAGTGFSITCAVSQDTLWGTGSSVGPGITYRWSGPCLESDPDSLWVIAGCPGTYALEVTDLNNNCSVIDSVSVLLDQDIPVAAVASVDTITCSTPEVLLDAMSSTPVGGLQFSWSGPGINGQSNDPAVTVDLPGSYQLIVTDMANACTDTLDLSVPVSADVPVADAGPDITLSCAEPTATIGGPGTSIGSNYSYRWVEVEGDLPGAVDEPVVTVNAEGIFRLIVTDNQTGCRDSSQVIVVEKQEIPGANAGVDQEINCGTEIAQLDGSNSVTGPDIVYQWTGPCLIGRTDSIGARADCVGPYVLTVTNTITGCSGTDTVLVNLNPIAPVVVLADTAFIDCNTGTALLDGSASSTGVYEWTRDGLVIASGNEQIEVDEAGIYVLTVDKQMGSCVAQDSIVVVSNCRTEAVILPPERITCLQSSVLLDASNSSGESLRFEWVAPDPACILTGQGTAVLEVSCGGEYTLIVTNEAVMQSDTQTVMVQRDDDLPLAVIGPPDTLNCVQNEVVLDGSASSTGPNIIYRWNRVANGALIAETASTTIQDPGTYVLSVMDTVSQCSTTASIRIVEFNLPISLSFGDSVLACGQDTFALTTFPTPLSDFYTYTWSGPDILELSDSATVLVGNTGTYSVTVIDQRSECQATASIVLTEDEQCAPCITIATPDTLTCTEPTVQLEADYCRTCTGCVLQWTTADGNIIADGNTLQPTVDRAGIYRLTVMDQQGFQTELEVTVTAENSLPSADAGPDRSLTCDSTFVNLGDASAVPSPAVVYQWTSPDIPGFVPLFQPGITVDAAGTYVLEVSDTTNGCLSRDTVKVAYDTLPPVADAGPDQMLTCNDPFVILNGGSSSSGSDFQFNWTGTAGGNCLQGTDAVNPIVSCPGSYYLEIRNIRTGCTAVDSVAVTSDGNQPLLTPFPDTSLDCTRDSVELMAELANVADYTYSWCILDTAGQVVPGSCVDQLRLMIGAPADYQFTATADSTGCTAGFMVTVEDARDIPLIDAGADRSFRCTDDSLLLSATAGPDAALLEIQWTSLAGLPVTNNNSLNPVIYAADTLVMFVVNPQTNCSKQDTVVITPDLDAPLADAGPDTAITCLQTSLRLQANSSSVGGNPISYRWSTMDGRILADENTATPLIDRPGNYLLTVSDDLNGCSATDAVTVAIRDDGPVAAIADLASLRFSCDIDTLLVDASISTAGNGGALDYEWSTLTSGNLIGSLDQSSVQVSTAGTYLLVVSEMGTGCRDSLPFTLSADVGTPSVLIAEPEMLTCTRSAVLLDASASEFGNDYSATWYDGQGNVLSTQGLTLSVSEPGNYSLQIDNLQTGCSTLSNVVTVAMDTISPTVIIAPADLLDCAINSVLLDASASSAGSDLAYQWTTAGGLLLDGASRIQATAGAPGTYILEISNARNGCTAVDSTLVEAVTTPIADAVWDMTAPGCTNDAGGSITVSEVIGGTAPFVFQLNDGAESTTGTFTTLRAGTYTLNIRDINGCEWSEQIVIPKAPPIAVDLGLDLTISSGDSIEIVAQTSSRDIVSYQWEPAVSTGPVAVVSPQLSGSYAVTVTDSNGCSASDRVRVIVEKSRSYYMPNVFSPNGDGFNDLFTVLTGPDVVNISVLRIYDRWGQLVFEKQNIPPNDPDLGWDGRYNGQPLNAAVFVYYAELEYTDGGIEVAQGDIALVR